MTDALPGLSLPGLDLGRMAEWLSSSGVGGGEHLSARLLAGGRSNLTYELSDGHRRWVVRRPPLGHVLETAHDMAREFRVISALQPTGVPVPRPVAICQDPAVIGAPFYLMDFVDGIPYRKARELEELGTMRTRAICDHVVDTLVELHSVDPGRVGLGDFGKPDGYLVRQARRWRTQLDASGSRPLPLADTLFAKLVTDIPEQSLPGIVHGDYRMDNLMVNGQDDVVAVLDWEMATLGDPLTDLAMMVVYSRIGAAVDSPVVSDVSAAPGFSSEGEMVARYSAASPRDLSRFSYYLGLAAFKLAVILEGIHFRFTGGQTVGDGFDQIGAVVEPLLEIGLHAIDDTRTLW